MSWQAKEGGQIDIVVPKAKCLFQTKPNRRCQDINSASAILKKTFLQPNGFKLTSLPCFKAEKGWPLFSLGDYLLPQKISTKNLIFI